jgi:hypothetical protein
MTSPSSHESHYILFTDPYSHVIILSVDENSSPLAPLFLIQNIYIFIDYMFFRNRPDLQVKIRARSVFIG